MRTKQARTDEPVMQTPSTLAEWRERIGELEREAADAEQLAIEKRAALRTGGRTPPGHRRTAQRVPVVRWRIPPLAQGLYDAGRARYRHAPVRRDGVRRRS